MGLFNRRRRGAPDTPDTSTSPAEPEREPFGYKTGWIAARTENLADVADALGIVDRRSARWSSGVAEAYDEGVFVCPAVDGWTLAMGEGILVGNIDLASLSTALDTEVHLFRTHRVVEHQSWALAVDGVISRSFEYLGESGEIIINEGAITPAEGNHPAAAHCSRLSVGAIDFDDGAEVPDESTVMAIASGWSLDPTSLEGPDSRTGIIGRLP